MIYEEHFSTEWDSLIRDEAMVRAFVLGIDAVRGDDTEDELDRLRAEDTPAFVEMAYNAGRRKCLDLKEETASESDRPDDPDDDLPTAEPSEVVSELLVSQHDAPAEDRSSYTKSNVDVPAMLDQFEFLDTRPDDQERLGLPDFLQR